MAVRAGPRRADRAGAPSTPRAPPRPAFTCCSRAPWCCRAGWARTTSRSAGPRRAACTRAPSPPTWATGCRRSTTTRCGRPSRRGSSCWTPSVFAELMHDWFPMAVHLLEGLFFGDKNTPAGDRAAGTAARARLAVGGPDPRAEQPGRGRGAGHRVAARAGGRDAAQAGHDRGRAMGPDHAGDADQAAGRGGRTGAEGARPGAAGGVRPGGRHHRLARRPRRAERLGDGPDVRGGRARRRLARPRRDGGGPGGPGGRAAVAELHRRDRAADERDRGLDHPDLHPGRRGQAVLAAGPGAVPGRRRARTAGQHAADAVREDPARASRW